LGREKTGKDLPGERIHAYHSSIVAPRAMNDAKDSWDLGQVFAGKLSEQDLGRVKQLEDDVIYPTVEMEKNGAVLDMELLDRWVNLSEIALTTALLDVHKIVGFVVNPRSSDDMCRLFHTRKIPIVHFTEKGAPSFDDGVLRTIDDPVVKKIRYAAKLSSLRSKFLVAYAEAVEEGGILRYSLHQLRSDDGGTISGRFSCSHVNIQQVMDPGKQREAFGYHNEDDSHDDEIFIIRQLFIAASGLFMSADASQVEYRGFAHYSASPKILKVYQDNPNADFHNTVREMILRIRDITRKRTKDVNFALIFGAGKAKTAAMLNLPMADANVLVEAYHEAFPEARALMRRAMHIAKHRGYVMTITGRRSRFPEHHRLHKALNAVIQGTAADIAKQKSVELHRARKQIGLTLRFPVHDEFVGDVVDLESKRMVQELLNQQSFKMNVLILWDVKVGANWKVC
jgi:DNA polymerase-1